MSVVDKNVVDGMALTKDKSGVIMLITDHLDWSIEYQHLISLQEKINLYIQFFEEKQYRNTYKINHITYGIIEIHFKFSLTANAERFLQVAQNQADRFGVKIQYCVTKENYDEAR